jgi:serine phosphatase RsbU (regulator of sigma subunit)
VNVILKSKTSQGRILGLLAFTIALSFPIFPIISNSVLLNDEVSEYSLGKKISYYKDDSGKKTIAEISNPEFLMNFVQSKEDNPSFGFQDSTYWIRIHFENQIGENSHFFLEEAFPPMDFMEVYFQEEGQFQSIILGDSIPFHHRIVNHRNHIIPLTILPGSSKTIFLKLRTKSVMVFRMKLFEERAFYTTTSREQFFFGIFYGIFLLLIFTNIFLYFSLKEKLYFYFVVFTFCLGMYFFVFNGFAYALLWPESSHWNDIANPLFMTLTLLTAIRTSIHFLRIIEYSTTIKNILDFLSVLTLLNLFFLFILPYKFAFYYIYIIIGPVAITILVGAVISLFRKNPMAKFFLLGFSGFIICAVFIALNNLGILAGYASPDLMQIASGIAIVLLSIGLAYRYYILKQQNSEIETKSIQINARLSRIQNELEISKKIHESLLPAKLPILKNAKMHAMYLPSGEIGGDFYDFHYSENKYLGVFIADVTGHGVPAALFASTVKFSFSREIELLKEPSKLLANINASLFEKIGNNLLSAGYFYLDLYNRRITYASCGHPPLLIWKKEDKEFIELKPRGRLIGISRDIVLHDTIYKLEEGDRILFYTDGLIECENTQEEAFGEKALHRFTFQNEDLNAEDFSNSLVKALNEYSSTPGRFSDDVTFIVVDIL